MKVEYINPFIEAVNNMMQTMMGVTPQRLNLSIKTEALTTGDVSGIIGFADKNITGAVALTFPIETVLKIYELMMGEKILTLTPEVQDTVGEMANIVAGGAKRTFAENGMPFHISIPSVITGRNHAIFHKIGTPVVVVPFLVEGLPFNMEVSMKVDNQ